MLLRFHYLCQYINPVLLSSDESVRFIELNLFIKYEGQIHKSKKNWITVRCDEEMAISLNYTLLFPFIILQMIFYISPG